MGDPKIIGFKQYNMSKHVEKLWNVGGNDSIEDDFEDPQRIVKLVFPKVRKYGNIILEF